MSSQIQNPGNALEHFSSILDKLVLLRPELRNTIISSFIQQNYKKGEILLNEGEISNHYLFLHKGYIRSYLYDTEGDDVTLNLFSQGEMVFDVASFFQRKPAAEYWQCLSDVEVLALNYETLNALFHGYPEFREFGRAMLVKGFINYKERTIAHINQTAEQRYTELLENRPDIFLQVPLKYIASYLGITDSSLSRLRREMSRD